MKSLFERRVEKLEAKSGQEYSDINCLICQGRFYDELSEEQRYRYCEYYGVDKQAFEDVNLAVIGTLHFKLEHKRKPSTRAEMNALIEEIEKLVIISDDKKENNNV